MSHPSSRNVLRWFDARDRQVGSWAFILNRLTALGLTFYLGLHLIVLNKLTQGAQSYNDFVAFAHLPLIKAGEIILIAAVILHGLNGVRLTLLAFGIGLRYQKILFVLSVIVTILAATLFAVRLFNK
jgi:succinate dehydrogenase / fumarate reductase, cytochrome b subunit